MKFFAREKPDAEFIEDIRRKVGRPHWLRFFYLGIGLLHLACAIVATIFIKDFYGYLSEGLDVRTVGLIIGIILGLIPGLWISLAALFFYWGREEYYNRRADRLLLDFFDKVKKSGCQQGAVGNEGHHGAD